MQEQAANRDVKVMLASSVLLYLCMHEHYDAIRLLLTPGSTFRGRLRQEALLNRPIRHNHASHLTSKRHVAYSRAVLQA